MKTEDEARECWCPHVRTMLVQAGSIPITAVPAHNSIIGPEGYDRCQSFPCIASSCMMWEWRHNEANRDESRDVWLGDCGLKRGKP